ncbi:glutamate-cysteine ligase family protein [Blastopirellula sp. JC732]|uniref:Glutamate-cysteine ligase family protein n=1 Tax=Blastopirellula sediminis TaxID=2894196 RepID=A0A9X1MN94_9BACT|nr:glutamate-cysteine ligase family protein [Blastopirellula sediminis]MCC9606354.1 glutamate-cysteine ligase family protein [Blastopirellula sediminis]MCC9630348.1 glutamate-cysteine ligase family protein [Blastopirellula sediminis]
MSDPLHLFDAFGVELEYMIVDAQSLDVRPIADLLLKEAAGEILSEIELGEIAWSNELALHVIELKTNGPAPSLDPLTDYFQQHVKQANDFLATFGARLLPTAMHPWMDPHAVQLWPHDYNPIYEAYNRIFDCRGHGWANLQSVHLNLPFAGDEEFGRLHAAIRLIMPLLPALAASSPICDGKPSGFLDTRMEVYRTNSQRIPSLTAAVVPEPIFTEGDYQREIFAKMYADIEPHDPEGMLQFPFLNARGAIARFDRGAIEIRVLDIQECPAADLAILQAIVATLKALVSEKWSPLAEQQLVATMPLSQLFLETIRTSDATPIEDGVLLRQFGWNDRHRPTAKELWRHILAELNMTPAKESPLDVILSEGPLARRILHRVGHDLTQLKSIYGELAECLSSGTMFRA